MIKIENDRSLFVDCDDTLVIYEWAPIKAADTIEIKNQKPGEEEYSWRVLPHYEHIKLIKKFKFLGYKVIVWSGTGAWWAEKVVQTLGLEKYVDVVMSKPLYYADDLEAGQFMGTRIYKENK